MKYRTIDPVINGRYFLVTGTSFLRFRFFLEFLDFFTDPVISTTTPFCLWSVLVTQSTFFRFRFPFLVFALVSLSFSVEFLTSDVTVLSLFRFRRKHATKKPCVASRFGSSLRHLSPNGDDVTPRLGNPGSASMTSNLKIEQSSCQIRLKNEFSPKLNGFIVWKI